MRQLQHFFNGILAYIRGFNRGVKRVRPEEMPPEALAQALAEARFLMGLHGVDVRVLAPGEAPQSPKVAHGEEPPMPVSPET